MLIRDIREDKDISQERVADFLGINQSSYSKIELGKRVFEVTEAIKIALLFDVSLYYLLGLSSIRRNNLSLEETLEVIKSLNLSKDQIWTIEYFAKKNLSAHGK